MKIWQEFKEFAFKGNVIDLAVGVIIGTAFSQIVSSLVNDIVMPLLGFLTGGTDFTNYKWVIGTDATVAYGTFIQNVVNFLLIAICVFAFVKLLSGVRKKNAAEEKTAAEAPAAEPTAEELLTEIRDLMKKENNSKTE